MTAPFALPAREPVEQIRGRTVAEARAGTNASAQSLPGFEPQWQDIVHYIVGITEEIWTDRAIGRIYDTYTEDCVIHTSLGTSRGIAGVVEGTVQSLYAFTDYSSQHLNIAWSRDGEDFYSSHLGLAQSTNTGATSFGPATGAKIARHFNADCLIRDNKIHTEWLTRDASAAVRQMGFDPRAVATRLLGLAPAEPLHPPSPLAPGDGQSPAGWAHRHFQEIWNERRFDRAAARYAENAAFHWPGGRHYEGAAAASSLPIGLLASVTGGKITVEHVCWSEESDGTILAVRWRLEGRSSPYGAIGDMPADRPISLIGMSHFRFADEKIIEEWTVFDEIAILVQALRA